MQRRRWTRRIGTVFGTVALGGLIGFLVPTILAEYAPAPQPMNINSALPIPTAATEIPIARMFINAFVVNDQERLRALGGSQVDTIKANDLANQVTTIDPPVLLGAIGGAGASLQAYASHVVMRDGTETVLSWRVLTTSGTATLIYTADPMPNQP
jgi:hypothetical protein